MVAACTKAGGMFAQLLAILALAVLQLSPLAATGYVSDDAGNSLIRGILRYHDYSLAGYCYAQGRTWVCDVARFFPLIWPQVYGTFYLFPNLLLSPQPLHLLSNPILAFFSIPHAETASQFAES